MSRRLWMRMGAAALAASLGGCGGAGTAANVIINGLPLAASVLTSPFLPNDPPPLPPAPRKRLPGPEVHPAKRHIETPPPPMAKPWRWWWT